MRKGYTEEENPFEQVIRYITNIRSSKAIDRKGRPIPVNDNTPFYAYIICDITEKVINLAENFYDYTPTRGQILAPSGASTFVSDRLIAMCLVYHWHRKR